MKIKDDVVTLAVAYKAATAPRVINETA